MVNIKEKKIELCCECNGELIGNEKYVCDMCKKMILEAEKAKEDEEE